MLFVFVGCEKIIVFRNFKLKDWKIWERLCSMEVNNIIIDVWMVSMILIFFGLLDWNMYEFLIV